MMKNLIFDLENGGWHEFDLYTSKYGTGYSPFSVLVTERLYTFDEVTKTMQFSENFTCDFFWFLFKISVPFIWAAKHIFIPVFTVYLHEHFWYFLLEDPWK